jgi:hypothetical protein
MALCCCPPDHIEALLLAGWAALEQGVVCVLDGAQPPMHWFRCSDDAASVCMRECLVAQAHAKDWRIGQLMEYVQAHAWRQVVGGDV